MRFAAVAIAMAASALLATAQEPISFGESYTIQSAILGEARTVNVWVPANAGMDERAPYRTVYLIDGGTAQDWFHITGLMQLGALSWTFEPAIVVGIETDDRQNELTPPAEDARYTEEFPTSGGAADFRAFITDEVASFISETFPVNGETAIIGESLAGLFVIDTYLKSPGAFDDYIAISPSLWWDDQRLGRDAASLLGNGNHADARLHIAIADEGGAMQAATDKLLAALDASDTDYSYRDYSETETHATIFHQAALDAVRDLYAEPPYDYGDTPWYLLEEGEAE